MNIRLQKYKQNRLAGMNIYNAARAAGYSESYARQIGPENKAKQSLADSFEQAGLTDKAIVNHALEGLEAKKCISCNVIAPNGEGMKDANSMTKDFVDVPDWQARHKYFDTILKLTYKLKDGPIIDQSTKINSTVVRIQIPETIRNKNDWEKFVERLNTDEKASNNA